MSKADQPVYIDTPHVLVTREWFDRAVKVMRGEFGCPFCGSLREPVLRDVFGKIDRGCLDCNHWYG